MLLQHSINTNESIKLLPLIMSLLLCACASGPKSADAGKKVADSRKGEMVVAQEIPPEAQTLYDRAVVLMAAGDSIDAELMFHDFLLRYSNYPGAHVNLAILYAANGDDEAAEGSITDALMIDPVHPVALNQLGILLRRKGDFTAAESAYSKAVAANPEYALAHYNLGVLNELYLQRLDVALQHYELYQGLVGNDEQVEKWIKDLKRRLDSKRRSANVTE